MPRLFLLLIFSAGSVVLNWKTFTDTNNQLTIQYPDTWVPQSTKKAIMFLSPRTSEKDRFQEYVSYSLQDFSKHPISLDDLSTLTEQQVTNNFGAKAIVSLQNSNLAGFPAKVLIYNMKLNGNLLKVKQCWFIKGTTAYVLTYTAELLQYNNYDATATQMMQSLTFY